jgi:two-component system, NarL family, response regulator NreC
MTEALNLIRIVIVDDHSIVRAGLIAILHQHENLEVVGAAATGADALRQAHRLQPHIVIMDLVLPDMNGTEAASRILAQLPLTRVIVLSACRTAEHVYRALRAGACGYVVKSALCDELKEAIDCVMDDRQYISPSAVPAVTDGTSFFSLPKSPMERLSWREREVLHQLVDGGTSASIGQLLCLSRKTVDTYRSRMMDKLGVRNRSELIRFAIENAPGAP